MSVANSYIVHLVLIAIIVVWHSCSFTYDDATQNITCEKPNAYDIST